MRSNAGMATRRGDGDLREAQVSALSWNFGLAWLGLGITSTVYAYEDGTDRKFRNVGTESSDAGRLPKKHNTALNTRRNFEIKILGSHAIGGQVEPKGAVDGKVEKKPLRLSGINPLVFQR